MEDYKTKARELVAQMTLEEKASLCSGKDFWHLKGIERFGLPEIMVTDGPHGLRKQAADADHLGINDSVPGASFGKLAFDASPRTVMAVFNNEAIPTRTWPLKDNHLVIAEFLN